jgi:hypothetical protein
MEKRSPHKGASPSTVHSPQRAPRGIQIFPAEELLGPFDMNFDPALAWLDCAKRHGEMFASSYWNPQRNVHQ